MSAFGDFDDDDAYDLEPPDPEQVARRLHELRRREGYELVGWDGLDDGERGSLTMIVAVLFAWLRRQGSFR